jgi:hypothetical protein
MIDDSRTFLVRLGKTQIDALFARQEQGPAIDDSEFLPLVEAMLTAFEKAESDSTVAEELWEYAFAVYDRIPNRDIDDLARYLEVFPSVRTALFGTVDRKDYCQLKLPATHIKATIFGHAEFPAFDESVTVVFSFVLLFGPFWLLQAQTTRRGIIIPRLLLRRQNAATTRATRPLARESPAAGHFVVMAVSSLPDC